MAKTSYLFEINMLLPSNIPKKQTSNEVKQRYRKVPNNNWCQKNIQVTIFKHRIIYFLVIFAKPK